MTPELFDASSAGLPRDEMVNVTRLALLLDGPVDVCRRGSNDNLNDGGEGSPVGVFEKLLETLPQLWLDLSLAALQASVKTSDDGWINTELRDLLRGSRALSRGQLATGANVPLDEPD